MTSPSEPRWPAGPKGNLLSGNLNAFGRDPIGFLEECVRDYGDFVPLRFFNKRVVIINEPNAIEAVLVTQSRHFTKTLGYRTPFMRRLFGEGLLTSEGSLWVRQRRLAQPAFHREKVASYAPIVVGFAERMMAGWRPGETRPIHSDIMKLTTEVVTKTLFNSGVPTEIDELGTASQAVMERFTAQWSGWRLLTSFLPNASDSRFKQVMKRLDAFIYRLIEERRKSAHDMGDLLSTLVQSQDESGGMTNRQLRDELTTLMVAGLDTTALALSWSCYLLALNPAAADSLRDELARVLAGRAPEFRDLAALKFTEAIIKEAMRLFPPAWLVGREAHADCEIGGCLIPRGTSLIMSQWLKHRDARIFPRAAEFVPERWLAPLDIPRFGYFPFGGGPRICIGSGFAMMEATLALAAIGQKIRFECAPGYVVKPWPSITLQPRGGIQLRVWPVENGN